MNILVLGASGNVGRAVLRHLQGSADLHLFTTTRRSEQAAGAQRWLDLEKPESLSTALVGIQRVFLMRPPELADVQRYFMPLVGTLVEQGVQHVVFLSVQGAERVRFIPHAKIEALLQRSAVPYTFVRPSYFMENLSGTLRDDIRQQDRIELPAGNAPFRWVAADDIGAGIAAILRDPQQHAYRAYTFTGPDLFAFPEVCVRLGEVLGRAIHYHSPGPITNYLRERGRTGNADLALVKTALHYLPRWQAPPPYTEELAQLIGHEPMHLSEFLRTHAHLWEC